MPDCMQHGDGSGNDAKTDVGRVILAAILGVWTAPTVAQDKSEDQ